MTKSLKDQIPKICMHLMVNALKSFASTELLANLYRSSGQDDLMEESPAEEARRKETMEMFVTPVFFFFFA